MRELDSTRTVTQHVVKFAAFSFIVSAIELEDNDKKENTLNSISQSLAQSSPFRTQLVGLILILWAIKDTNKGVYFFGLSQNPDTMKRYE